MVKLTEENYNQTLEDSKYIFVEYYSNTCGHCVSFAPEYEKLATQLKGDKSEYVIAAVDLSVEEEVTKWVTVQGYPTLKFFVKGVELDYSGNRKAADIIAVNGDPLRNVRELESVDFVMRAGKVFKN